MGSKKTGESEAPEKPLSDSILSLNRNFTIPELLLLPSHDLFQVMYCNDLLNQTSSYCPIIGLILLLWPINNMGINL